MEIKVNLNPGYKVIIGEGNIVTKGLPEGFVVVDEKVAKLYENLIPENSFIVKSVEENKSLETYFALLKKLGNAKRIVAVGGGLVGDLAGFAASTYKRGIELIHVPTTLLAMVDSSIGGKNGVNLDGKKNYVGTIYQPKEVIIDILFLKTLPEKEFKNGVAEIVKSGYLFNSPSLERMQKGVSVNDEDLKEIIFNSCESKARVVEKDEKENGFRAVLNFGHTIGHAIELSHGLSHGEAVSIGMVKELQLGCELGFLEENNIENVLKINNLPVNLPEDFDVEKAIELMKNDKKGSLVFSFSAEKYMIRVEEEKIRSFFT